MWGRKKEGGFYIVWLRGAIGLLVRQLSPGPAGVEFSTHKLSTDHTQAGLKFSAVSRLKKTPAFSSDYLVMYCYKKIFSRTKNWRFCRFSVDNS
jgi:hypothetical protein